MGIALALPAAWLTWETAAAEAQATLITEAAADRTRTALQELFGRFERATAPLRAQDLTADPIATTARLLRAELLVSPSVGLSLVNGRGQQVAASTAAGPQGSGPVWWFRQATAARPAVLGCGLRSADGQGFMLVRGIAGPQEMPAGWVGSQLPEAILRAFATPAAGPVGYLLGDAEGCELLAGTPAEVAGPVAAPWLRLYRRLLPEAWTTPQAAVAEIRVGNLVWTGTIAPPAVLALRAAAIERHSRLVLALVGGLAGACLIAAGGAVALGRRRGGVAPLPAGPAESEAAIRRKLEEISGERDRVLAAIGHDVRTPMNSILGICALLQDGDLDDTQRKWLQRIRASCQALLAMLNGMLEIAAARVDGAEVNREAVDVAGLVGEAGEVLRPQAEDKGLDLRVTIEDGVLGIWHADPTRLRQILFNLGGNAIKYTIHGVVELRAAIRLEGERPMLRLAVADTGPGITEAERQIIFEQFRRGRDEVCRGQEGLGLGLALCRDIATLLGGSLSVESTPGAGSTFTFEVPVERTAAAANLGGTAAGRAALVVGLSDGMRRRVASHLEGIGCIVETAGDGFLALGLAERMAFQHGALDMIVVDAALPGLSAEALTLRLKARKPLDGAKVVLVANGAAGGESAVRADAVVPHPVEAQQLHRIVANLFGDRSVLQGLDPRSPAPPRARVLVVEDNRINQALFVDQLVRAGFSTFAASNGREAVEAANRGGFDGILMDVQMPELDGIEATRLIRDGEPAGQRIPIIGMTAHTGSLVRKRCLDAGMDAVLHKPVDFAALPLRLRDAIAAARLVAPPGQAQEAGPAVDPTLDIADEYLMVLVGEVGLEAAASCVAAFLGAAPAHMADMAGQFEAGAWDELGRTAHRLAGIAGTLGAITLSDGLLMLEDAVRDGENPATGAVFAEVRETWARTRTSLKQRFDAIAAEHRGSSSRAA